MTVLFITHDMGVVAEIADVVLVMYRGKVMEHGLVDKIFHAPKKRLHPRPDRFCCKAGKESREVRLSRPPIKPDTPALVKSKICRCNFHPALKP